MAKNNDTRVSLIVKGEEIMAAKMQSDEPLDAVEFMELLENFVYSVPFDQYQIEGYLIEWAKEIKAKREN